jgi:GH24 family phage-related lysozyme (muramidase)
MSLSNLHTLDDATGANSEYRTRRYEILGLLEGNVPAPYFDNKGFITIGIGFNIDGTTSANRSLVMAEMNLTLGEQSTVNAVWIAPGMATIRAMPQATMAQLDAKNAALRTYLNDALGGGQTFTMTDPQINAVFDELMVDSVAAVSSSISTPSEEQIILISLYHNATALFGPKLRAAIASGDRAEAWYQIRYGHEDELWDRRYAEAKYFGLYGSGATTPNEAKSIYRMFTAHRTEMLSVDATHFDDIANNAYGTPVPQLDAALDGAKTVLVGILNSENNLSLDASDYVATNIYRDPGRDRAVLGGIAVSLDPNHSAALISAQYDASGNEIATKDILIGEGGTDHLLGGKGDDVLLGGLGDDFYYFRPGDGQDIVVDEDGQGTLIRGSQTLAPGIATSVNQWAVEGTTYTRSGADLEITFADNVRHGQDHYQGF